MNISFSYIVCVELYSILKSVNDPDGVSFVNITKPLSYIMFPHIVLPLTKLEYPSSSYTLPLLLSVNLTVPTLIPSPYLCCGIDMSPNESSNILSSVDAYDFLLPTSVRIDAFDESL